MIAEAGASASVAAPSEQKESDVGMEVDQPPAEVHSKRKAEEEAPAEGSKKARFGECHVMIMFEKGEYVDLHCATVEPAPSSLKR